MTKKKSIMWLRNKSTKRSYTTLLAKNNEIKKWKNEGEKYSTAKAAKERSNSKNIKPVN